MKRTNWWIDTFSPGGHSTLKWVGVFGAKRRTVGLKNGFLAKIGAKELQFYRKFWGKELKSRAKNGLCERQNSKNLPIVGLKIKNFRQWGLPNWSKLQLGVWSQLPDSLKKGVLTARHTRISLSCVCPSHPDRHLCPTLNLIKICCFQENVKVKRCVVWYNLVK